MKTYLIAITTLATLMLTSCGGGDSTQATAASASSDKAVATLASDSQPSAAAQRITIDGNIDHTQYKGSVESTITFEHFPHSVADFESAMAQLGDEPQGAVVLLLMAMELYRNDEQAGTKCLELINTDSNLPGTVRLLKDKLRGTDSYARPYQVASFMQGATPMNGYNAPTPYKVKVRTHPSNPYQKSEMLKGWVLELQVYSDGFDTPWRGVQVIKSKGDDHYRIFGCSSLITQCKEISWETDAEFNGLK